VTGSRTALFGLLGSPVDHSLSPAMMTAAFEARAMDAVYLAFDVGPAALATAVTGLRALGARGANVTTPHKETIVPLLDELAPSARAAGAVNTIVCEAGRWIGHNTDGVGFVEALREAHVDPRGGHAVLLGAGGAARAVAAGLAEAGVSSITVAARSATRAADLLASLRALHPAPTFRATGIDDATTFDGHTTLVVHCTPAGMTGGPDGEALAAALPLATLARTATVVDLVYQPRETPLLRTAASHGLRALSGLPMLLHQGAAAFALWTGHAAPVEVMRRALGVL
jgi:shikimate dehydrogenase